MYVDPEFVRQVDNAIRADLQSWRDLYFTLLIWSSILVGVGVLLEGPEVIHDARNIWRSPHLEAKSWMKLVGLLGWVLVVVGVAGEGIFEGALSVSDGQIQTFDEILLADAQRQAGEADKLASENEKEAAQLRKDAEDERGRRLGLQRALATEIDKEQAAEQQLESEKVKRLRLAVSLRDREIFDQSGAMTRLSSLQPRTVIFVYSEEREAKQYAEQIAFMFANLHWHVLGRPFPQDRFGSGVAVKSGQRFAAPTNISEVKERVDEQDEAERVEKFVREVLGDAGADVITDAVRGKETSEYQVVPGSTDEPPFVLMIFVGPKNNKELDESLRELGAPQPSPFMGKGTFLGRGARISRDRFTIPTDPTFNPKSAWP